MYIDFIVIICNFFLRFERINIQYLIHEIRTKHVVNRHILFNEYIIEGTILFPFCSIVLISLNFIFPFKFLHEYFYF